MSDLIERLRALPVWTVGAMTPGWQEHGATAYEAADELTALRERVAELTRVLTGVREHYGNFTPGPGHSHAEPGIWDADNHPFLAGTRCEWCALWEEGRAILAKQEASHE